MAPPGITRQRRPFLAPLWLSLLALLLVGGLLWTFYHDASTTIVLLVRPADDATVAVADAHPSAAGAERAQRLDRMFGVNMGAGRIDAIYESDDRRAKETGAPLAARLQQSPTRFSAAQADVTAARAVREHAGGAVLIIASGPVLEKMAEQLLGGELARVVGDSADLVCVVSIPRVGRAQLTRFGY